MQLSRSVGSYRSKPQSERSVQRSDFFEGVKEAEQQPADESPPSAPTEKKKRRRWWLN